MVTPTSTAAAPGPVESERSLAYGTLQIIIPKRTGSTPPPLSAPAHKNENNRAQTASVPAIPTSQSMDALSFRQSNSFIPISSPDTPITTPAAIAKAEEEASRARANPTPYPVGALQRARLGWTAFPKSEDTKSCASEGSSLKPGSAMG